MIRQAPMYYPTLNKLNMKEKADDEEDEDEDVEYEDDDVEYEDGEDEDGEDEDVKDVKDEVDGEEVELTLFDRLTLDRLTLDLMINHKYLAKTHPTHKIKQREFQERILKNRKEIMKIIHDCFRYLEEGDSEPLCRNHLNDRFKEFAKLALEEIEHRKLPEADEMFQEKA